MGLPLGGDGPPSEQERGRITIKKISTVNVIAFILGQVADVDTASSSDTLGSRFKHRSVFKYGFFSPKPKGSTELGAPLWTFELSEGDGGDSQKGKM